MSQLIKSLISSGVGLVTGAGQMIAGSIQRKKADALLPPSESVMERQMLQSIRRRRRAMETGTAGSADRAAIRQMGKSFGRNAFAGGGKGNFGQLAALQSQAMQNLASTYGQQIGQTMQLEQQQVGRMADLSNDLALLRSNRMSALAEKNTKDGRSNLLTALGGKGGAGEGFDVKTGNLNRNSEEEDEVNTDPSITKD